MNTNPQCVTGCCVDCTIQESDFPGTASSTVSGFTELEGDWGIDGAGGLTATGPALIRGNTPHPDGAAGNQVTTVRFTGEGSGVVRPGGVVALVDADNYLLAEVYLDDAGCDFLRLYKVSGGTPTQLGDDQPIIGAVLGEEYSLQVCWEPAIGSGGSAGAGTLRARVSGGSLEFDAGNQATTTSLGTYGGLSIVGGAVTFRQYRFKYMQGEGFTTCPDCNTPCPISGDDMEDAAKSACLWDGATPSGGKLVTTGRTKHLVFHPQLKGHIQVSASVLYGASSSATISINDDDAGNALTAVYETDTDSLTLTLYNSGTELDTFTFDGIVFPSPFETTFQACFDGKLFSASIQNVCVDAPTTEIPGGKWAALDGNATWDDFSLSKAGSDEDPEDDCGSCFCPPHAKSCDDCCTHSVESEYVLDFGDGGWGGQLYNYAVVIFGTLEFECDVCDLVRGEFVVTDEVPDDIEPGDACAWYYFLEDVCPDGPFIFDLFITLSIYQLTGEDRCRWVGSATITYRKRSGTFITLRCADDGEFFGCTSPGTGSQQAIYISEQIDEENCDEMPVELTKVASVDPGGSSLECGCPCDGVLPDTITLNRP